MILLTIDVGNTNIVLGVYDQKTLLHSFRMTTNTNQTSDEIGMFLSNLLKYWDVNINNIIDVIISSVVPSINRNLKNAIEKYLHIKTIFVDHNMKTGIDIDMQNPKELGMDRLVNIVAAYNLYEGASIIIDYGTANTYDAVNKQGRFVTGITSPGINICAEALYKKTSMLSKVDILDPKTIIAKDTKTSIQAGIMYSVIGETEYIVNKIKKEIGCCNIIGTGGFASIISQSTDIFTDINENLTLEGLRIIYSMIQNNSIFIS